MDEILRVQQLTKLLDGQPIVQDVSFVLYRGQKMAIAGETGSGKSSLLKMITGYIQPDSGQTLFKNKRVEGPLEKLLPGHPGIAYLSQYFELRNNYTVSEELSYTNQLSDAEADTIYHICQIGHLLQRRTNQLSGGEKQRIALARQLVKKPELLVLDEPFSNLDSIHKNTIKNVLHNITARLGITTLLVSHDAADVLSWADELLLMKEGKMIQQGKPEQVYNQPLNLYCAGLLGAYNLITNHNTAFTQLQQLNWLTGSFILRPEYLSLQVNNQEFVVEGKVAGILFLGSHYLVQVTVAGETLLSYCMATDLPAIGSVVRAGFSSGNIAFISE